MSPKPPRVDLHVHSVYSDGVLTPDELVQRALRLGLAALGLVDHDTLAGLTAFREAGRRHGLPTCGGIELSAEIDGDEIHLLGFGVDPAARHPTLDLLARRRVDRLEQILARLRERCGLDLAPDHPALTPTADGAVVGRPHVARALVAAGAVKSVPEAFARYLRDGGPADVRKTLPNARTAIELIRAIGGRVYLAHPGAEHAERHLDTLRAAGLDGLEAYHPKHSGEQTAKYLRYAGAHGLAVCGGSDFHAPGPGSELGVPIVPADVLRALRPD